MRYLIRGGVSPLAQYIPDIQAKRDIIGTNSGNLLYLYSVCRSVYTEKTFFDLDGYKAEANKYSDADIEEINAKYDAYICPLADAFRNDFIQKLLNYAAFFEKLTIPVVIIGVGLRVPVNVDLRNTSFKFDNAAKEFVSAALNHGEMLGLRGETTGRYLKKLGFRPEKDYTVIGCPSMYSKGANLPYITKPEITPESPIIVSMNSSSSDKEYQFFDWIFRRYDNSVYIGQNADDFKTYYYGLPHHENLCFYPNNASHMIIAQNRMRFYVHAKQWFDDIQNFELSVGNRLHGNIASIIAGIPSILFLSDARSLELAEYHGIPHVDSAKCLKEDMTLEGLIDSVDFSAINRLHTKNFNHYVDFLNKNRLEHIYKENRSITVARLDKEVTVPARLKPYVECNHNEAIARHSVYLERRIAQIVKK